jgi:hypothetical protein
MSHWLTQNALKLCLFWFQTFGEQAYFLNFVSKFESDSETTLGVANSYAGILAYSADFTGGTTIRPRGGRYGLVLAEALLTKL